MKKELVAIFGLTLVIGICTKPCASTVSKSPVTFISSGNIISTLHIASTGRFSSKYTLPVDVYATIVF